MILFVDDEERRVGVYVEELTISGFEVVHIQSPDEAWDYIDAHYGMLDLAILDLMMPHGPRFKHLDTDDGLRTGVRLYERIRQLSPDLPVVFLSNVFEEEARLRRDPASYYLMKRDYLPHEFASEVREIMKRRSRPPAT